jgi:hypothetical protein
MYGEVAWFGAAPFAAPSVVEDVPPPGWVDASVNAITVPLYYMLTVPFEPSAVPLELFCMVADLESVMVVVCTSRYERGGRSPGELTTNAVAQGVGRMQVAFIHLE